MDVEINKGKNIDDYLSDSEESFNMGGNTRGNPANRATKYQPPNFLFEDKD